MPNVIQYEIDICTSNICSYLYLYLCVHKFR